MGTAGKTITAICRMNAAAKEARSICTDIIRQTQPTPYYGKIGGAAIHATDNASVEQINNVADALEHLRAANQLLRDIAERGGMTRAQMEVEREAEMLEKNGFYVRKESITDIEI